MLINGLISGDLPSLLFAKKREKPLLVPFLILFFLPAYVFAGDLIPHHSIHARLDPEAQMISVKDTVTLPDEMGHVVRFVLHKGLSPASLTPEVGIEREKAGDFGDTYRAVLPEGKRTFTLAYSGRIFHPVESSEKEQARGMSTTPGIISGEGVVLSGSSLWYPAFDAPFVRFSLTVEVPAGWDAVSQGKRILHGKEKDRTVVQWDSPEPQDEIFLISAGFTEYSRSAGRVTAMAFLRSTDQGLAEKYLEAAFRYLAMYEQMIGPYPYVKFALVENFWETGFGMPSFTLLGPKVIRLPFIINSSYPHEILHNWWGNSVFPDYAGGNWSEGLTAYLSDHLIKEQQGSGAEYRQATLQKYSDYVSAGRDFPLTAFRSRHSPPSEAVGYGKALMFFHMLRQELGDDDFIAGLRGFYRRNKFHIASFEDIRRDMEEASGRDLRAFFSQWVERQGAPELRLKGAEARQEGGEYWLRVFLEQMQEGPEYALRVPLAVTIEGGNEAYQAVISMAAREVELSLLLPGRPLRVDVDPEFDLFRRLLREETPAAISQALGDQEMLVILPSGAEKRLLDAYRLLAEALGRSGPERVEVKTDVEVGTIPTDRVVTVLGWENRFSKAVTEELRGYGLVTEEQTVRIGSAEIPREGRSFVLSSRNPVNKDRAMLFIASDLSEALPGLGRKLPHYHKYSFLGFEGDEPANVLKGRWPVLASPLTAFLPDSEGKVKRVEMARPSGRRPLATLPQVFSQERMMETVRFLSGEDLQGRGFGSPGLDRAAVFIAEQFRLAGLEPAGNDGYFQAWEAEAGEPAQRAILKNVIGMIPGRNPKLKGRSVVIGAHYDHLGLGWPDVRGENRGKVHPGADDNASGVAVLLELSRVLGGSPGPDRSVIFIAFSGEEAGRLGSRHYLRTSGGLPAGGAFAMINLDTVGRLGKGKLLVLGADSAREWPHIFRGAGYVTGVEIGAVSEELDSSDQKSFQEAGVPAVQLFTGPHPDYHRPSDTPDRVDAGGLLKVAAVAREAVEYLAMRKEPLTAKEHPGERQETVRKDVRKAGLGVIPDFAYTGQGCRLSGVMPGSPAEACGLQAGDVIIRINELPVAGLKDLSDILKTLAPGAKVAITFIRDGREITVGAEVKEK